MKAREYEAIIENCRRSGLTIRAYCEREGISPETFHTWVRRSRKRHGITDERKTYAQYRAVVIAGKTCGKPAKEWCAEQGINYGTYCNWSKKVNRKEGRENIDRECGIERVPYVREPEPKVTGNPILCEIRR